LKKWGITGGLNSSLKKLKHDDPKNGCITHPELIKAFLKVAQHHGYDFKVIEGGFYGKSAEKCFREFGLKEITECINLNEDEFQEVEIGGKALKSVKVAKTALKAKDGYVSMPKMKVHHLTKVTLGIKNNMGFLKKPAIYMHPNIHRKLVDLLEFFQPSLVIVDGIIGGTNSEMSTKPIRHGILFVSDNVIAADIVAAKLMGFRPEEIEHIRIAMERFGVEEGDIEILSNPGIEKLVRKDYRLSLGSRFLGRLGI
jgi:uncharacterized protein (DUF362 family)